MSVEVEPFEPLQSGLCLSESSYSNNRGEFVYDVKQCLRNSSVWPRDYVYPHKNVTTSENKSDFSFASENNQSEFMLVRQAIPSINQSNGYLYVGDEEEPSCGQDPDPNATINLGTATESLSATAGNMVIHGWQAVSPAPSDPGDPPSRSCSVSTDEMASVHNQDHGVEMLSLSLEEPGGDSNEECVTTPMNTGCVLDEVSVQEVKALGSIVQPKDDPWPMRKPSLSSVPSYLIVEKEAARKFSDPVDLRRDSFKHKRLRRQRCVSDGEAPKISAEEDEYKSEEGESSALGQDSGFHDEIRPRFHGSMSPWGTNSPAMSDAESPHELTKVRRATPHPLYPAGGSEKESPSEDSRPPLTHAYRAKRQLTKHLSAGSIGGTSFSSLGASSESQSVSSLWDCPSPQTVTDVLSSLGFDDFDSPQLVPDRFIPGDIEYVKPTLMRLNTLIAEQDDLPLPLSPDSVASAPATYDHFSDLPLGATAENFQSKRISVSPPPALAVSNITPASRARPESLLPSSVAIYTNPSISQFRRDNVALETVPEETASDLSPSPRWLSPRVSIDHSVIDVQEGKLGASLAVQKSRKRSLPTQRDGYKLSIGSQVESEPDSIYFSVTSYDDDIAAEREKEKEEFSTPLPVEDSLLLRRRRRGVYTPPPGLLSWLSSQPSISEEESGEPEDLPWPFNEQAHLRKSLSEIHQAQQTAISEPTCGSEALREDASIPPNGPGRPLSPSTPLYTAHLNNEEVYAVPPDTLPPDVAQALGYKNDHPCLGLELDSTQAEDRKTEQALQDIAQHLAGSEQGGSQDVQSKQQQSGQLQEMSDPT